MKYTFKQARIKITFSHKGKKRKFRVVKAWVCGGLGIHLMQFKKKARFNRLLCKQWNVTHVVTGLAVHKDIEGRPAALKVASLYLDCGNFERSRLSMKRDKKFVAEVRLLKSILR
jgi:hypothetical protein